MNNFIRQNKNRIGIWIAGVILAISLGTGIYKAYDMWMDISKGGTSTDNSGTNDNKRQINISKAPSLETLNKIEKWVLEDEAEGEEFRNYNYAITQYYGVHIGMINTVLSQIGDISDEIGAENVVGLLDSFAMEIDSTLYYLEENEKVGVIPPKFIIIQIEKQLENFKTHNIADNIIYKEFKKKLKGMNISDGNKKELIRNMEKVLQGKIYTGFGKLLKHLKGLEERANNDAGVWRFKGGDRYYEYMLRHNTSLNMDPGEVYDLGLVEINKIQAEIEDEFIKIGYKGTLKENMFSLNNDSNFLYPAGREGEEQLLEDYKAIIENMYAHMGELFELIPAGKLMVMPIAEVTEEASAQAYYYPAMTEGNSSGIFYVNVLKPTFKYDMQSIAFHEGIPGHHLQMALQSELLSEIYPDKSGFYMPAYIEGWGLYAEMLADEYGMYEDSYSRLGYLRGELLRAVRLVVDTGIHYKKWTREYAIEYMKSFGCIPDEFVEAEIDRYIVNPGQACSYKIGQLKIVELRERAREELGEDFNIKDFHSVILRNGPMPFGIMEEEVQKYIDEVK